MIVKWSIKMKNKLVLLSTLFGVCALLFSNVALAVDEKPVANDDQDVQADDQKAMAMPEQVIQLPDAYVGGRSSVVRNPTININQERNINYSRNIHHLQNIYKLNHTHNHLRTNNKLHNHHKMHTKIYNQFGQSFSADSTSSVSESYETMPTVEVNSQVTTVVGSYYPNLYGYGSFCHPYYGGRFFRHCRGF